MFRSKNQPSHLRMPKQQTLPGVNDLQFVLSQAQKMRGCTVEVPWFNVDRSHSFMLTVRHDQDAIEPLWTLFKGDNEQAAAVWQHTSADVSLIQSLALQAAPESAAISDRQVSGVGAAEAATSYDSASQRPQLSDIQVAKERGGKTILKGELENMPVSALLQSVSMSNMTGRLEIVSQASTAQVFFDEGQLVHALSGETLGENTIIEIMTWQDGQFCFFPAERTQEKTVNRRLEVLIIDGVKLLDQYKYLLKANLRPESFLISEYPNISDVELKQRLERGMPLNFVSQQKFYKSINNKSTLLDVLRCYPLTKIEWIPILFNLHACGLVSIVNTTGGKTGWSSSHEVDRSAIQSVFRVLTRPETEIFTYPAFLYFLEQEFYKCASVGWPLTLVIFEMNMRSADKLEPLPIPIVREAVSRIAGIKRCFDILGHWETFDYALLLPNTNTQAGKIFAQRVSDLVTKEMAVAGFTKEIVIFFGLASAPEDSQDLGVLASAARIAKSKAVQTGQFVVLFQDIEHK